MDSVAASRKVQIGNGQFLAEGMSEEEITRLLREARSLTVIDTEPDDNAEHR